MRYIGVDLALCAIGVDLARCAIGVDLAQGAIDRPPIVFVSQAKSVSVFVSFFVFHLLCDLALSAVGQLGVALGAGKFVALHKG